MGELKKRYRYYMLMRPFGPGTAPKGVKDWGELDPNVLIESIGHHAWAWIEYDHPLTIEEVREYELCEAFERMIRARKQKGLGVEGCWETPEKVMKWWLEIKD